MEIDDDIIDPLLDGNVSEDDANDADDAGDTGDTDDANDADDADDIDDTDDADDIDDTDDAENHGDLIVEDRVESIEVPPCRICMENRSIICFVPCGHVCACSYCSQRIDKCPLCRTSITKRQGLYFA